MSETAAEYTIPTETETMDCITQARHNFLLAFQYCWNGEEFPVFKEISVSELGDIHTGYLAIGLLDEALDLHPKFQEARSLRGDIWHAILMNNREDHYEKYLNSKAWSEIREECFNHFGRQCLFCSNPATQVHHRDYTNIGKENFLTDLSVLCSDCHKIFHKLRNPNPNDPWAKAIEYWDQFKTYVEENGNQLQLFPEPNLPSIYGIQIDRKTLRAEDRYKDGAFWLIAYRSANKLQANLCMQSSAHYNVLKEQKEIIEEQFDDNLGELRWADDKKWIGFSNNTVGNVRTANTDQEFLWLHDRLVKLHAVFQPRVLELQEGT